MILAQAVQHERDRLVERFAQKLSTCAQKQFAPNTCNTPLFLLVLLEIG